MGRDRDGVRRAAAVLLALLAAVSLVVGVLSVAAREVLYDPARIPALAHDLLDEPAVRIAIVEKLTTRLTTIAPFLRPDRATIEQAAELLTTTPTFERTFAAAVASLQGDLQRGGAPEVVLRLDGMLTALRDGLQRTDGQRFALPDTELTGVLLIDRGPVERYRSLDDASRTSGWPAIVLGVLVAVGAVLAAPRRRGALFGVGVAVFAAALVALASIALAKSAVVSQIDTSSGQDAVSAVWDVIALEVRRDLVWLMLAGLIVAVTGLSLQAFRPRRPPPPG